MAFVNSANPSYIMMKNYNIIQNKHINTLIHALKIIHNHT